MSLYSAMFGHVMFPLYEQTICRRNTLRYLRRLEEQQWLPSEDIRALQWEKLLALLRHAEERVPFYADRFRRAGFTTGRISSPDDLRRLPMLTKDDIRQNQQAMVAAGVSPESLHPSGTGGSTGEPIRFRYSHDAYEWRVAAAARADRWAGWDWGVKQFYVWGVPLQPERRVVRLKKRLHNALLRLKVVSSFDFNDEVMARYADAYNRYRPVVVVGYTNALCEFARFASAQGISLRPPKSVVTTAESLHPHQRELLETVFAARVFDRYGCREMMNIAAECDRHQGLHVNADNLYLELEKDSVPVPDGQVGEVLVTDLNNYAMPFIRYQNGDMAVAAASTCTCGRGLPLLNRVAGRILDVIVAPDGRHVPGEYFPHLLKDYAGIKRFQVYQDRSHAVTVRMVPGPAFDSSSLADIRAKITQRLGPAVPLRIELTDDIPLSKSGKHRVTISEVWANGRDASEEGRDCAAQ